MVGDYLKITEPDKFAGFIGRVQNIGGPSKYLTMYLEPYHSVDVFIEDVEGIPLTPQILEKNGFGKLVTYGTEKWVCDNFRLNVYDSRGTWRFCADTNRNENSVIYIRFIHQLQHALRLCGIEKEIKL